ncbi:shikimate dehydrogenase [Halonotius roseus]|uniref:Shikimate dehydrogenase (NADP(+)) n=1 Tax=Halonotius roseus TaxID=2511997 RepID=A0A544QRR4_9EURY|nr:shikimate dehydrogenase [Halonotius roseus]TQQ82136.1 shikimate dehydrogenase [Halonotius roseus]
MDVYGIVGNPVGHSVSPPMQTAGFDERGIDATYVTFEPAESEIERAIDGAAALGIAGLNVTIPFKQDVFEIVEADPLAARIGAVNTVAFPEDGSPQGYNTDAAGVTRSFAHHDVAIDNTEAVVVGAGGAGRATAFALADAGAGVHIANRTVERAEGLADEVDGATAGGLDSLAEMLPSADLLVNATSVGMEEDKTPVPAELLHEELAVLDAVYTPRETRLLRETDAAGATTIQGLWMLLFQGVEAFERWTGEDAPIDAMHDALREALN